MLVGTVTNSNFKLGTLISMGAFTGIFVQYLAGIISDRSNFRIGKRKPFILGGAILAALFIAALPVAKTYAMMFVVSFLFYFCLNFFQGPYYTLIPEVVNDTQLGLANGFSKIISVLGSGVILLTGPKLWDLNHAYPFLAAALLGIVSVLAGTLPIKENPDKYTKPTKISFDFLNYPSVLKLFISVFFIFLSYGCITPYFVKYCEQHLGFSAGTASTGLFVLTIVGALFAVPAGILSDKKDRRFVLLVGIIIFATGLALASFAKGTTNMYILLSLIGVGFICIQVTIYAILAEIAPPDRLGEFMGIMNLFISLSQWIANLAMGFLLDKAGFGYFFPISSVIMFVAATVICFCRFEKINK
jgi:MFS family permease